jgi:hypothetical protein
VHAICSVEWDDPNASFGEGHKCFKCAGTQQPPSVPPPPSDAADTSPRHKKNSHNAIVVLLRLRWIGQCQKTRNISHTSPEALEEEW